MSKTIIQVENITKTYGSMNAVDNVSLDIMSNEFFALLGPSGCGKTTLLRMIAGFTVPTSGRVLIDGQDMNSIPPEKRPVNMVFQSYAVFPHMSVEKNVAYGLEVVGTPKTEITERVGNALERVGLSDFAKRKPDQLSGGQRQRVALARALVKQPKVLLLDEPLSALDAKLREQMQTELAHLQQDVGVTFVIVTHDQDEALSMADRIAVMRNGVVEQLADPGDLYESPANKFVADFIGKVNMLDGAVSGVKGSKVSIDTKMLGKVSLAHEGTASGDVSLALRPEKIAISKSKSKSTGSLGTNGKIIDWAYYGDCSHMTVDTGETGRLGVVIQNTTRSTVEALDIGDEVYLSWKPEDMLLLKD